MENRIPLLIFYPNTPGTNAALRAIFGRLWMIDDFKHNGEEIGAWNSQLIQYLEEKGYDVKFIGDYHRILDNRYLTGEIVHECSNIKWWNGLQRLLHSAKPCFYMFHCLAESHTPILSPDLLSISKNIHIQDAQQQYQVETSLAYLDECLSLYHRLLGGKIQIYFSDHGNGRYWYAQQHWLECMMHTFCFVVGEEIPRRTVQRFFPHRNFLQLVKWLIEPEKYSLEDVCEDVHIFQDIDVYNLRMIQKFIDYEIPQFAIAFRGVITKQYKYVIDSLGNEFFYLRKENGEEILSGLEDNCLRKELQRQCGTKFLDIYQLDKFKYSQKLYESIRFAKEGRYKGIPDVKT